MIVSSLTVYCFLLSKVIVKAHIDLSGNLMTKEGDWFW
ncbi:hypothetical protein BTN49_2491 [Candidatus Enterovibrio escicola]|uniref:Uncharacterized protein n=1 Tax=Candidatus Enterovibrio escicola TaxID=1927127 RepID=A0A2A5T1K3_9GAMM|nr:hypothetical protein BTN49_2491 [Candidatus Enterovibrio escacola]